MTIPAHPDPLALRSVTYRFTGQAREDIRWIAERRANYGRTLSGLLMLLLREERRRLEAREAKERSSSPPPAPRP